jgi:hypothetical protein
MLILTEHLQLQGAAAPERPAMINLADIDSPFFWCPALKFDFQIISAIFADSPPSCDFWNDLPWPDRKR